MKLRRMSAASSRLKGCVVTSSSAKLEDVDGVIPVAQSRSREAQARLLKAGEKVFARKGYDQAHVLEIAAAAECSVGSFYRRFRDKESLFIALHQQFTERSRTNLDRFFAMPEWKDTPTNQVIRQLVSNTARVIERHPGFFRALFQRTLTDTERTGYFAPLRATDKYAGKRLCEFLQSRGHDADEEACVFGLRTVEAALIHRALHDSMTVRSPFVIDSLTQMLVSYLGVQETKPRRGSRLR